MNIFYLDHDPVECANYLAGSRFHHNKMITESCQLMGTAIRLKLGRPGILYRPKHKDGPMVNYDYVLQGEDYRRFDVPLVTHKNHKSGVWVQKSVNAWVWLFDYTQALCNLWRQYRGKQHGSERYLESMIDYLDCLPSMPLTEPPRAMDKYMLTSQYNEAWSTIDAYHNYMLDTKSHLLFCQLNFIQN